MQRFMFLLKVSFIGIVIFQIIHFVHKYEEKLVFFFKASQSAISCTYS